MYPFGNAKEAYTLRGDYCAVKSSRYQHHLTTAATSSLSEILPSQVN
jgi:hypothetical protein